VLELLQGICFFGKCLTVIVRDSPILKADVQMPAPTLEETLENWDSSGYVEPFNQSSACVAALMGPYIVGEATM
jgi:hypothetical protein